MKAKKIKIEFSKRDLLNHLRNRSENLNEFIICRKKTICIVSKYRIKKITLVKPGKKITALSIDNGISGMIINTKRIGR